VEGPQPGDVRGLSERSQHRPNHAILGFYAGNVGFVLPEVEILTETPAGATRGVPHLLLEVRSELVAMENQLAITGDLRRSSCLLRAATAHHQRHAEAASPEALQRFGAELPTTLGPEIGRNVHSRPFLPKAGNDQMRSFIEGTLPRSVAEFTARLAVLQELADTWTRYEAWFLATTFRTRSNRILPVHPGP